MSSTPPILSKALRVVQVLAVCAWSAADGCYLAWSPQFGCVRDADTVEEALSLCIEAVEIRLESYLERNTLANQLSRIGYRLEPADAEGSLETYYLPEGSIFSNSGNAGSDLPQLAVQELFLRFLRLGS